MNIGIVVGDLSPSQLSYYVTKNINDECHNSNEHDFIVFVENFSSESLKPNFSIMSIDEIWSFHGVLIATSISTALHVAKAVNGSKKYFYVWDLEWMRPHGHDFNYNIEAFNHEKMNLITRSDSHAKAIKNYCNRDACGVVEDFNLKEIYGIINTNDN